MSKYTQYADDVLSGNIVAGEYVKQSCKRFYDFLKREDIEFREDKVDRVLTFCNKVCHSHNKNLEIELQPWQVFIFANIFGFYYKGTKDRVCKTAYIEVARKNGKSTLISLLSLYMMMADGEYQSEVDCVANSAKQAKILFDMASNYCQSIDPKSKYFKRYRDQIKFDKTKSKIQVLSSDTSSLDGFSPYLFVCDEIHEYTDSKMYNVLKTGQGARNNPIGVLITTAGLSMDGFCYQFRQNCIEIMYGLKQDDSMFSMIFCLDENDDWNNEEVWVKANPNIDVSIKRNYLKEQVVNANNNSSLTSNILTKNFNIWSQTFDVWIEDNYVVSAMKEEPLDNFVGKQCFVGVDLAAVSDLTAVSLMRIEDGVYYYHTKYYIPSSCLSHNYNQEKYREWMNNGYLTSINGNCTDYDYIVNDFSKWRNDGILIENVFYDSWNSTQWAVTMTEQGFNLTPFSQSIGNFNRGTKEFERLLKTGQIVIDKNPITRWCLQNARLKVDFNENCKPVKAGTSNDKIDGCIAMIQAVGGYLLEPQYTVMI